MEFIDKWGGVAYKKAFDDSPIGMAFVSREGRWLKVNQSLVNMLGYSQDEFMEKIFQDITHPEDLDADLGLVEKMLLKEISHYQMEKRYFAKDGEVVWAILSVTLIWKDEQTPHFFVSQIQNITEIKEKMVQLDKLNQAMVDRELKMVELKNKLRGE